MGGGSIDKLNVIYVCPDASLGGSTRSLINLILSVKEMVNPIVLLPSLGKAYDYFIEMGVEVVVIPFILLHEIHSIDCISFIKNPTKSAIYKYLSTDIKCAWIIKKKYKNRDIDIVHSNFSSVTIGVLLAKVLRAKHVWHIREFLDLDFNFKVYLGKTRLRRLINHADARIFISNAVSEHWHLKKSNTQLLFNAIGPKQDIIYKEQKDKYLLFCSYFLTEKKGAKKTITAFGMSNVWKEGYKLALMGNCTNTYKDELINCATLYNCADYIEFIPCQENVKLFFAKASAFIMASDCEAFGRVTAEAMFWGCPVIAHSTGGTLDLVKNGYTGWLFNTEEECASLIQKVCSESQDYIIKNAQNFVLNNLTIELYGSKIMDVYYSVLNR